MIDDNARLTLVMRGGKSLSKMGTLPSFEEVKQHLVVMQSRKYDDLTIVEASTGDPPDGWCWMSTAELQRGLPTNIALKIGGALLCS